MNILCPNHKVISDTNANFGKAEPGAVSYSRMRRMTSTTAAMGLISYIQAYCGLT